LRGYGRGMAIRWTIKGMRKEHGGKAEGNKLKKRAREIF
jgi:hypothetical protein